MTANPLSELALQFQTPETTVGVSRSGTTYTLKRPDGMGWTSEWDLPFITVGGTSIHCLRDCRVTDGVSPFTIMGATNLAYEYALTMDGGVFIGNGAHGNDNETSFTVAVDGSTVALADGGSATGAFIDLFRASTLTDPSKVGPVALSTVQYRMAPAGLDLDIAIAWLQAMTGAQCYMAMMPVVEALSRGRTLGGAQADLTANDQSVKSASQSGTAALWTPADKFGACIHLRTLDGVADWHYSDGRDLWIQDRTGGTTNKVYAGFTGRNVVPGDVWRSSFRLLAGRFDGGADGTLTA